MFPAMPKTGHNHSHGSHHSHRQMREDNFGLDREKEMIRNRIKLVLLVLVIGYWFEASWNVYVGLLAHLVGSLAIAITYRFQNTPSNVRRFAGLCTDFGAGVYLFSIGGESVAALYPLYLWIILGYGFRFGNRWLFIAAAMGSSSFAWSIFNVPFWQENQSLATGLVIGLLVVPGYCSTLITKISVAKEEAEQANKAKTLFLASISHELRTPLNAIIGYGTHLLEAKMPEDQKQMIGTSVSAGRHLLHLINQLLSFAKSESLEELPVPQSFRPIDVLTEVRDILKISAEEKGLSLNLQAEAMSDHLVAGQVDYVKNILINLTSNAVKFTDQGSVTIKCGFKEVGDSHSLWCSVTDTGPGIAKDAQEKIFGVFQQADDSVSRKFGGTGLGLSICRQLAQQLGGEVSVESDIGKGSIFSFTCPIELVADHGDQEVSKSVNILSLSSKPEAPEITGAQTGETEIEHIDCSEVDDLAAILDTAELQKFDIALISADIAGQIPDGSAIWTHFVDAALPPVLLSAEGTKSLDEIQLRAAFASVLPTTPDFDNVRSVVQIGCSFTVDKHSDAVAPASAPVEFAPRKILVADDNRTNQMVLETILANAGHEIVLVGDGEAALDELENGNFDIVFLDVNMPKLGGIECCKRWRLMENAKHHIPVIGLTADSTPETEKKCLDAGMDLRLTKPIESSLLLKTIERQTATIATTDIQMKASDPFDKVHQMGPSSDTGQEPAIDANQLDYLLSIGDQEFVQSIIDAYLEDSKQILVDFTNAVENQDIEEFRFHAHAFKSGANNIGATKLSEICGRLEVVTEGDFRQNRSGYLVKVNDEMTRVVQYLNAYGQDQAVTESVSIGKTG